MYARVSTEEQAIHGLSIEAQITALEEWAKANGHKIVDTYIDAGISARKPAKRRPELQRLLADAKADKGDLIVFTKLDRWFRNIAEYYKVQEVLEKYHIDWRTIHEDYDTSTASGRLKINIMLSVAQDEADRTSERIKAINEMKRQKLEPLSGSIPTGYKVDGKKIIKDPEKEEAINTFFHEYIASGSIAGAANKLQDDFGINLSYQLASKILSSPAYCGTFYGIDGMTPPYISREEYDRIQGMRKRTVRKVEQGRVYLFSGLIICGDCGKRMGGAFGVKSANPYYHCSGHYARTRVCSNTVNMNEKKLADYLLGTIDQKVNFYRAEVKRIENSKKGKSYKSEIASVQKKIDRLKYLYLDDLITIEEYKADREALNAKLEELQKKECPVKKPNLAFLDSALQKGWQDSYQDIGRESKKRFWRILIKEIRIYPDRHIEFDLNI